MHTRKGFTLIELLVVITIIAILAVIVFTQVQGLTARARNTTTQTTVREAGNAINVFRNTDGTNDSVILPINSESTASNADVRLSSVGGTAAWGPFTGTLNATGQTSGTYDANSQFQYPVRITRTASTNHALRYAVFSSGSTLYAGPATYRTLQTIGTSACVVIEGILVNDASYLYSFYRNGTVGTGGTGNGSTTGTVATVNCTTP